VVTVGAQASNGVTFSVQMPPAISSVSPASGALGQAVTINGTNFGASQGSSTVAFDGTTAAVTGWSTTSVGVTVPAGATSGPVVVVVSDQSSNSAQFTITNGSGVASVTYAYDELGRLVGVIDAAGQSAVYVYDAVGNLLAIERHAAGTVSIVEFTPDSGPTGTSVTITGTGFSTTPSQNTVTFNDVPASVASSTENHIIAAVPAGASSGTVGITTPSGSASSTTSFIVGASVVPTITGLTPGVGAAGTAVTVSGTNFDAIAANNRVKFSGTHAAVSSSSSSSISTTVPALTASGRITVATPTGAAVGGDFFIPPPPYVASDVDFTGRATAGQAITASLAASTIGLVVFDGTAGQRISLFGSNGTIAGYVLGCDAPVTILKPDTIALTSICMEGSGFLDVTTLPASGTYTILVDPESVASGTLPLMLYDVPADFSGSITPGGSPVTIPTMAVGQNAVLTFSGTANQRVALLGSGGISGQIAVYCDVDATIRKPDGSRLATACMEGSGFIDVQTLPSTGTYTVFVDPASYVVGGVTLTLYDVPADVSGTLTVGGDAFPVTITTPGQSAVLTFAGTPTQQVTVRFTGNTAGSVSVWLLKPNGSTLTATTSSAASFNLDTQTLPDTGSYTIIVDPNQLNTGTMNVSVTNP
jgi:YD repeat-containing protein